MESPMPHRRRRAEIEDDEAADNIRDSQRSTPFSESGKRARTDGYQASESPEPHDWDARGSHHQSAAVKAHENRGPAEAAELGAGEFQPGAIIRVKLTNFVTYEAAEFFPGPNLNMVIGPNGTGKSSLVCAICLGLGWGPKHLGRAGEYGEFVKHNTTEAYIEIELQGRKTDQGNHVVRVKIIKENNKREWWLNNKKVSMQAVQELAKSFSIQIDNLCQFLPQDKVSEFAALTPVELLQQTQRAAAPEEMLEYHDALKKYRKEQKALEIQNENDKEELEKVQIRQEGLRAEAQKLEERKKIIKEIDFLKKCKPFVEYKKARLDHAAAKQRKNEEQDRYRKLQSRLAPTLENLEQKKTASRLVNGAVRERVQALKAAEQLADTCLRELAAKDEEVLKWEQNRKAEYDVDKNVRTEIAKLERKLVDLKAEANQEPIQFNPVEFNERARAKQAEVRNIQNQIWDLSESDAKLVSTAREKKAAIDSAEGNLVEFDTQAGQQIGKLKDASRDTAEAWKWVQDNMESFEKEVYGPPIISCSITDQRYANIVETNLSLNDFIAITAQTKADHRRLQDHILSKTGMGLAHISVRISSEDDLPRCPSLTQQEMEQFGFDGWAMNFIDGPAPVLNMLCSSARINTTAVALKDVTDSQHTMLVDDGRVTNWVTGGSQCKIIRRREYGPAAQSINTQNVKNARFWTDQPVDSAAKQQLQQKIAQLKADFQIMKAKVTPLREQLKILRSDVANLEQEIKEINREKSDLQRAQGEQKALPEKIAREEERIESKLQQRQTIQEEVRMIDNKHDLTVQSKAKKAFAYKEAVEKIRQSHDDLLNVEIRLIEANSDVSALEERNGGIVQRLEEAKEQVRQLEASFAGFKATAKRAMNACVEIQSNEDDETVRRLGALDDAVTEESLEHDIGAEESRLEFMHANNPRAIEQFEKFQSDAQKLQEKVNGVDETLARLQRRITKVRARWEPELDKLISTISDAFSYNFEQIGCAGSVAVEKTEDFEDWAILIKVKFRESEQLQVLDKHRQSGGERSVSTIFYLMALQSLARSPFRVVDEINQGMDPRNERMVHERMVEIACKEHTSQYFLITPKLLTGLRYDRRMKVLCIASGEYMPKDHTLLDVKKIISLRRAMVAAA